MKSFRWPESSWLSVEVFDRLVGEHDKHWQTVERGVFQSDVHVYMTVQNQAMLLKFFLEQAFGTGGPIGETARVIQRDFESAEKFAEAWLSEAAKDGVDWLVFGLSFADFRFHLFPICTTGMPFCISPVLCTCLRTDVIALSGLTRKQFAEVQWNHIDWLIVEQRIACLEKPLDVLGDGQDCLEDAMDTQTPEEV